MAVPASRLGLIHDRPPDPSAAYVLYWMTAARRPTWNFALDRAVEWSRDLRLPIVVFEALECDYPWASDRLHRFVIDGMRDNAAAFSKCGIAYYPYVEPSPGAGRGLLRALAGSAAVVVTDNSPAFFLPSLLRDAARQIDARLEAVDGCGVLPLGAPAAGQVFPSAYAFRRYLQRELPVHLEQWPNRAAVEPGSVPAPVPLSSHLVDRWPMADLERLARPGALAALPIDHSVLPVEVPGGAFAAAVQLDAFVASGLDRYGAARNHPDAEVSSRLSPYLHFGQISAHEIVARVLEHANWTPAALATTASGAREGWWGVPAAVESFLDQVVTWRELGFNMSARRPDCATFESLPSWAIVTLEAHAGDPRQHVYTLDAFAAAATHDAIWNAAQRQLLREGRTHNYLRMLWGKKILEWTRSPREALEVMFTLNDRYALDGRDPNSVSGIQWVLGRYDRPWAPARPIYGTVRYMSSDNTARKLRLKQYLQRYAEGGRGTLFP